MEAEQPPVNRREKLARASAPEPPPQKKKLVTGNVNLPGGGVAIVRAADADDECVLASIAYQEKDEAIDRWLAGCTLDLNGRGAPEVSDVLQLYVGDWNEIALNIIKITYGNVMTFNGDCMFCQLTNKLNLNVDAALASSTKYPDAKEYEVPIPSGRKAICGYNTRMHRKSVRKSAALSLVDMIHIRLKRLDTHPATAHTWNELDGPDRAALRAGIIAHPEGGPDMLVVNKCEGCEKRFITLLEDNISFFLPGMRLG